MIFGSLFAGIGGFDLGFERAGLECRFQVEIDPYCQKVLAKHWPNAGRWDDVRTFPPSPAEDWNVDVICGGFPCQDISNAGKRAGLSGKQSGLWTEFARIICVLRPRIVVVENVAALLGRGMGRVLGDLAASGYDAEWQCIPACVVGAPHIRDRVFIVAYNREKRAERVFKKKISRQSAFSWCKDVRGVEGLRNRHDIPPPLFRGSRDGIPNWMDRVGSIGNAVVPQIAEYIGRSILIAEDIADIGV